MKILVIVVTYNGLKWLDRCLGSVRASELPADLYVWDNDSTDGSADWVQGHFPEAKLVRSAEDAWLEPSTLGTLVAASEAHPDYAVLSPLQMTDGFQALDQRFEKILESAGGTHFQNLCHPSTVTKVMAAHWLIPRTALETVGMFDPLFPIYGNDDNWCDRARYHGFKVGIVPEARAVHDRAYRQEPKEKVIYRNYYMGSLVRLCDINRPLWERFLFVCLFTLVKAVKYGSILPFKHFRALCRMLPEIRISRLRSAK